MKRINVIAALIFMVSGLAFLASEYRKAMTATSSVSGGLVFDGSRSAIPYGVRDATDRSSRSNSSLPGHFTENRPGGEPKAENRTVIGPRAGLDQGLRVPGFAELYLRAYRGSVLQFYGAFLREKGMVAHQQQQFADIMTKSRENWTDLRVRVLQGEIGNDTKERTEREIREQRDSEIKALLGESAPQELRKYRDTLPTRDLVATVSSSAFSVGEPISHAQSEQLVRLISETVDVHVGNQRWIVPEDEDYRRLTVAASKWLSASQNEALSNVLVRHRESAHRERAEKGP